MERAITKIDVEIEGICPILFNKFFDPESISRARKKKTQQDYDDEIQLKVYRETPKGPIGIPSVNIKKSMLEGVTSAGIKIGRRSAINYFRATVFLEEDFVSLGVKTWDGIHECTGRRPPKKGGAVLIKRPYLTQGWKGQFKIMAMDQRVSPEMIKDALSEAGLIHGLCDHRAEFGRFIINKFEIEKA